MDDFINKLFTSYTEAIEWSEREEQLAITEALAGDDGATRLLLTAYGPLLKKVKSSAPWQASDEDLISAVLLGFSEALVSFRPEKHRRLAAVLKGALTAEVSKIATVSSGFHIPSRTLSRFFFLLRMTDGNVYEAMALAPSYSMTTSTFLTVLGSLRDVTSVEERLDAGDIEGAWRTVTGPLSVPQPVDESDLSLVGMVFATEGDENDLTDAELEALEVTYGFHPDDFSDQTKTDEETAEILGISRSTAQKTRTRGLNKCRARLGLTV